MVNRLRRRQVPGAPFLIVFGCWQQCVTWMSVRSQPRDELHQIFLCHRRAASGWPILAAPNMKKNCASCTGHGRIGIVSDINKPFIREIARAHFFVRVIVRRILRINHDMAIVVLRARVVAPNVCLSDLMIWIVPSGRQVGIVSKDLSNFENSSRRATISLFLSKTRLVLPCRTRAPGDAVLAEEHWKRSRNSSPLSAAASFK